MVYSFTGHRPHKLGGYTTETYNRITNFALFKLEQLKPEYCITGMALGWDLAVAAACCQLKIPYVAAIPFPQQADIWNENDKWLWNFYKLHADKVVVVSEKFSIANLQKRNEWMVDHSGCTIALYDGSKGGAYNCIKYAESKDKPVVNWWNDWISYNTPLDKLLT